MNAAPASSSPADVLVRWFVTGGGLLGEDEAPPIEPGERIGPFRVEAELGRGGMATVYRARRDDGAFDQTVALKVLALAPDGPAARRFREERQLLARLDHPGIARLYDGGELPSGAPYLVLELVRGEPLDVHAATASLDRRLDLFLEVCRAVAAAHREEIVHHDLKPANILVDRHGHPKLLDFGIARALAAADDSDRRLLTPRYAAPEQFEGRSAGPATDVFQLGLLLYRLTVGTPANAGGTLDALRERAGHLPLLRASEADCPDRRRLDRHFDAIVARCLARQPDDRYGTVAALAADLEAWRAGRPSSITGHGLGARLGHQLRRRWPALAALTAALAAAAVFLSWSLTVVDREQARSRAVSELVTDVLAPGAGDTDTISSSSFEIARGAVADQPRLERRLARITAERLLAAGEARATIDLLEPVLTRVSGSFETPTEELARLYGLLGRAYLASGRPDAALGRLTTAIRLSRAPGPAGASAAASNVTVVLHELQAVAQLELGAPEQAAEVLATALRLPALDAPGRRRLEEAQARLAAARAGRCGELPAPPAAGSPLAAAVARACTSGRLRADVPGSQGP